MVSPAGLYLPIAVNLVTSHTPKQRPPCQPCEAVCAASASWVASTHLRGSEARCWGLCGPLSRSTVLPRGVSKAVQKESLEGGHITQPLNNFLLLHQAESPSICVRQNAQGKGRAEGSILKQDKRWCHRFSHRPAVRAGSAENRRFLAFRGLFWEI